MGHAHVQIDVFSFGILLWEMLTGQLPWGELSSPMQARLSSASSHSIPYHGSRCYCYQDQMPLGALTDEELLHCR